MLRNNSLADPSMASRAMRLAVISVRPDGKERLVCSRWIAKSGQQSAGSVLFVLELHVRKSRCFATDWSDDSLNDRAPKGNAGGECILVVERSSKH